jgi:Ca-activated chloride channel family protein
MNAVARVCMGCVCLLLAAGFVGRAKTAGAQETSTQEVPAPVAREYPEAGTLRVQSRLVPVAVNVTDAKGVPVGGLTRDDFEVMEDGAPQRVAVFENEAVTPLDIVLSIDASESVIDDQKLEREAARQFVKTLLRPQDRLDVMSFADRVNELVPFTNDLHAIDDGLGRLRRGEATALYDAVYLAAERLRAQSGGGGRRRVIVLITDGDNTTAHGSYDQALAQAQHAGAMIYSLIIVPIEADAGRNTGGEHALVQLSDDTGGKYFYVSDKHDLAPAFARVSDDLRAQYTLAYYAPEHGGDDSGLRHIRVQLKDPALRAQYTLRYRTAYYGR